MFCCKRACFIGTSVEETCFEEYSSNGSCFKRGFLKGICFECSSNDVSSIEAACCLRTTPFCSSSLCSDGSEVSDPNMVCMLCLCATSLARGRMLTMNGEDDLSDRERETGILLL